MLEKILNFFGLTMAPEEPTKRYCAPPTDPDRWVRKLLSEVNRIRAPQAKPRED